MDIRNLKTSDLSEYARLVQYSFATPANRAPVYAKWAGTHLHCMFGAFEQGQMLGGMWYYPYDMRVGDDLIPMGGVAAVGTFPEARNRRVVQHMMSAAHRQMREDDRPLAVLMPFRGSFYARMGYSHVFFHNEWTFAPADLKKPSTHRATVRRVDGQTEWKVLEQIHQLHGQRYTGTCRRNKAYWSYKWLTDDDASLTVYVAECNGSPVGYMLARRSLDSEQKQLLRVADAAWTDSDAFTAIVNILWAHRDQVKSITWQLPCDVDLFPYFTEPETQSAKRRPKMMLKLVDVKAAIERRTYPADLSAEVVLDIEADSTSTWNRGQWKVTWDHGHATVRRTRSAARRSVAMSIQTLSLVYSGVQRADALSEMGIVKVTPAESDILTRAFFSKCPYMREWF